MDPKKIIMIVGSIIVALGAAFGVNYLIRGSSGPEARAAAAPAVTGPKVMVATRPLPVGTILTQDALRFQPWPEGMVKPDQYYIEGSADLSALVGSVVRVAMTAGAPVTRGALVNPADRGFLAAALGPGMRAITVPLSPDQGVAGFVFPGDRVDILLTLEIEDEQGGGAELHTTETIVRNLRVLAVDQRSTPMDENGNSTPVLYGNVTLEATPQMAEKIAVARSVGTLSLSLRSLTDSAAELEEAIATGAVSVPRDGDARAEARMLGGANSRPTDRGVTSVTGGDVSRYLRRGLPPRRALPVPAAPSYQPSYTPPGGRAPASPAVPTDSGPSVRIIRGAQQPTIVPVGR